MTAKTDRLGRVRPSVYKVGRFWMAVVTRGFSGNYEQSYALRETLPEAHDWARNQVKDWRP